MYACITETLDVYACGSGSCVYEVYAPCISATWECMCSYVNINKAQSKVCVSRGCVCVCGYEWGVGGGSGKQQTPNVCVCDAALDFDAQPGSTGMSIAYACAWTSRHFCEEMHACAYMCVNKAYAHGNFRGGNACTYVCEWIRQMIKAILWGDVCTWVYACMN
jgi:hypothetical protein